MLGEVPSKELVSCFFVDSGETLLGEVVAQLLPGTFFAPRTDQVALGSMETEGFSGRAPASMSGEGGLPLLV